MFISTVNTYSSWHNGNTACDSEEKNNSIKHKNELFSNNNTFFVLAEVLKINYTYISFSAKIFLYMAKIWVFNIIILSAPLNEF